MERRIAAALFAVYLTVNATLFIVFPSVGLWDWPYWGKPVRDALAVGTAIALGLPLFAITFGFRPA